MTFIESWKRFDQKLWDTMLTWLMSICFMVIIITFVIVMSIVFGGG